MPKKIVQLNEEVIKVELKELVPTRIAGGFLFRAFRT